MAEDKKKPRKPVVGSRAPSSAPRKIAGRDPRPEPADSPPASPPAPQSSPTAPQSSPTAPTAPMAPTAKPSKPRGSARTRMQQAGGVLVRPVTTKVLAVVLAVLTLAAAGLGWYVFIDDPVEDAASSSCYQPGEDYEIAEHPVTVPDLDWRAAREASTQAVVKILTANWKTYDKHVEDAQKLMTREWAQKEYLNTARDTRENFLKNKADYKFAVVGESVVCASSDEITSLLFLNQHVYKGEGEDRVGPDIYQVRVIVTAVRQGETWLVDRLDAL